MLLVDAANVVGSRPTGWWRDRAKAANEFVADLRAATAGSRLSPPVVVVLEGLGRRGVEKGVVDGVEVLHASGHGDDTIVAVAHAGAGPVTLVWSRPSACRPLSGGGLRGCRAELASSPDQVLNGPPRSSGDARGLAAQAVTAVADEDVLGVTGRAVRSEAV